MNDLREVQPQLQQQPDQQLSLTDPDARSMATSGRGTEILDAEKTGVQTYMPKPMTSVASEPPRVQGGVLA